MIETEKRTGNQLKKGDLIEVWWSSYPGQKESNYDRIRKLVPYEGSFCSTVFKQGARLAWFDNNSVVGMTIENTGIYNVVVKKNFLTN